MKYLERSFPWLLLVPVLLPVVVWNGLIYGYLVPKTLSFYAVTFVTAGVFTVLATHGKAFFWHRLRRWEAWVPGALLVLAYVASYFGLGFYHSFWSLFVRGDGLLMLTCVAASFYMILVSADSRFFDRFTRAVAWVASFVAVYGIGEWLVSGGRIGSLIGNAAFFAGYLGIALFLTFMAARTVSGGWRKAAYAGAALQVIAIILTATRGSMLALGVALLVYLVYRAWRGEGKTRRRAAGLLIALVVLGGLFAAFRSDLAKVPFGPIERIATASATSTDIASRLFIWSHMAGEIAQHPWLGVGAEHIDVLFNQFYDPTQIVEQWFDRSHNAFLDYAAQYGVGGLLLYLALIASFFTAAWRLGKRGERSVAGLAGLLAVVYATQIFFVFDTVTSFWLLLAALAFLLARSYEEVPASALALPSTSRYGSWFVLGILIICIYPVSVRPWIAAHDLYEAFLYQSVNVPQYLAYFTNGFALNTYGDVEYGYEAYDMYVNHQLQYLSGQNLVQAYHATESVLETDFQSYPYDARTALYLAHVLSLAPKGVTVDHTLLSEALARAIKLSPKRSQPWYILVNLSIGQANQYPVGSQERTSGYAAARDLLTKYLALVPTLAEPHFVLAQLEYASGDASAAAAQAALGDKYYRPDAKASVRAAAYYEVTHQWTEAKKYLTDAVNLNPGNVGLALDLAKVTYMTGDPAAAVTLAKQIEAAHPGSLASDPAFQAAVTSYEQSHPSAK